MVNIIREICIFYALISIFCWIKSYGGCFRQVFFHLGNKNSDRWLLKQLIVLCSNGSMGIDLGKLRIGRLRRVGVLERWSFEQV